MPLLEVLLVAEQCPGGCVKWHMLQSHVSELHSQVLPLEHSAWSQHLYLCPLAVFFPMAGVPFPTCGFQCSMAPPMILAAKSLLSDHSTEHDSHYTELFLISLFYSKYTIVIAWFVGSSVYLVASPTPS